MKTAGEYRAMAEECFRWARQAQTSEMRVSLRQLAQIWLDVASTGLPPTGTPTAREQRSKLTMKTIRRSQVGSGHVSPSCRAAKNRSPGAATNKKAPGHLTLGPG